MPEYTAFKPIEKATPISKEIVKEKIVRLQIMKSKGEENGTATIYTVPKGKIFVWEGVIFQNADTSGNQSYLNVDGKDVLGLMALPVTPTAQLIQTSFITPKIYYEDVAFKVRSEGAGTIAYATIYGFEIQPKDLDKLD